MPVSLHDHLDGIRCQFPALTRLAGHQPAAFFDGPAGTQVPQSVIDAVSQYFVQHNANHGGLFATSQESSGAGGSSGFRLSPTFVTLVITLNMILLP